MKLEILLTDFRNIQNSQFCERA